MPGSAVATAAAVINPASRKGLSLFISFLQLGNAVALQCVAHATKETGAILRTCIGVIDLSLSGTFQIPPIRPTLAPVTQLVGFLIASGA